MGLLFLLYNIVMKMSRSPERHTFQANAYIERCREAGEEPDPSYLAMYESHKKMDDERENDPEWRKNNLEWDLRTTPWILDKVIKDSYAQNLYAALCNMRWQKIDVFPILKDEYWSCSWRSAGGIVANMQGKGDYMDWYCSGIGGGDEPDVYNAGYDLKRKGYVPESTVTDEIREDLARLGWQPNEWPDEA